jgi:hypothetical protein
MVKTIIAKVLVLFLFLSYILSLVSVSKADTMGPTGAAAAYKPYIVYPANSVYSNVLTLNVSFRAQVWGNVKYTMNYSLDGQESQPLIW